MPSSFPCSSMNRECPWKKTQIEKKMCIWQRKEIRYPWWKFSLFDKKNVKEIHGIHWDFMVWCNQTFFVNNNGIKVNKENYHRRLRRDLCPDIEKFVKRDDWVFAQDGAPSHRSHLVQDCLKTKLKRCFIRATEWLLFSPDVNPLDYFYWDFVKTKVHERKSGKPFASKAVWNICANNLVPIRKATKYFVPRRKAVEGKQGRCIKMLFG